MTDRPHVPEALRCQVLLEAGYRCAMPGCRETTVELHHIIPYAECPSHEYENLIALCADCHARQHRGDIPCKALQAAKGNMMLLNARYSTLEIRVLKSFAVPGGLGDMLAEP